MKKYEIKKLGTTLAKMNETYNGYCVTVFPVAELKTGCYVSLMTDIIFKAVFLRESFKLYLAKFLSYYLNLSIEEIYEKAVIKDSHIPKSEVDDKTEMGDLVIEIGDIIVSIEANNTNMAGRNFEYACRLSASKMKIGSKKYNYTDVIQININNYILKGIERTHEMYEIKNEYGGLYNRLRIDQIYIPNIKKKYYDSGEDASKLEPFEKNALIFFESDRALVEKLLEGEDIMKNYVEDLEKTLIGDDLREAYDHQAEEKRAMEMMGHARGREEGKNSIIKNMLKNGLKPEEIHKFTGIPYEEIKVLTTV